MKLITKYNRVNTIATLLVLLIAGISYYFIVRYILIHQLDNTLKVEEAEILDHVRTTNQLPEPTNYKDQHTAFEETDQPVTRRFRNIRMHGAGDGEQEPYRKLVFPVVVGGKFYAASVTKSEVEMEDLVGLIVLTTLAVVLLLLLIIFISNRLLLRKIWQPFYDMLQSISRFNLTNKKYIPNPNTDIDEFRDLDAALSTMTGTIIKDYETLKNFADNASHEMQTPLAVIISKLDLMIQEPDLGPDKISQLQAMYDAVKRLSRLNQSLLLLTKIENKQFTRAEPVRMDLLIREKLASLEDIAAAKQVNVELDTQEVTVQMDEYLSDILLNNLLNNAIRHNYAQGSIHIRLEPHRLSVSNTGPKLGFDATHIFDRFKKGDHSAGVGLGLAIVKQICDNYRFPVAYSFNEGFHSFTILF